MKTNLTTSLMLTAIMLGIAGCNISAPRPRMGTLPTPPPGPRFVDPDNIGGHSYHFNPFEKNAIVYTCRGGHIDLTHLRWNADYTKYLYEKTRETLLKNRKGFSFNVTWESSTHNITFEYPSYWRTLARRDKKRIADEVALSAGPYIAFNATLWHEIITWFGTRFAGFEPEFNSAFSWEDLFSNLLGTRLGLKALQSDLDYDQAMEIAINEELEWLGAQSRKTSIHASAKMRGKWYTGVIHVDTKKRNFDVGFDGYITPTLVPDIEGCPNPKPISYPIPNLNVLISYGFDLTHEIEPNIWEEDKIFQALKDQTGLNQDIKLINTRLHYRPLIKYMKNQAVEQYGYDIDD